MSRANRKKPTTPADRPQPKKKGAKKASPRSAGPIKEIGGVKGPEPTRYGDWEQNGRCSDF